MITFLSKCTKLEHLDLSYNNLQDVGIAKANISSLTSFNISHNNITINAANYIANFLSQNLHIQMFDLCCDGLLELGVRHIFTDMKVVHDIFSLSVLNISNCIIINETVYELMGILLCNTELKELVLSYNNILTPNTVKIFEAM